MADFKEEFLTLLKQERRKDLFPLLQTLDDKTRKAFSPDLKKLDKEYNEFKYVEHAFGGGRYEYTSTEVQREILRLTYFVCHNRADFQRSSMGGMFNKATLDEILPWYCPPWFSDHVNAFADGEFVPYFLDYNWYMELVEQGYVKPRAELIAQIMPRAIEVPQTRGQAVYDFQLLLKRPITLEEHIWYVFDYQSQINSTYGPNQEWFTLFKQFTNEGKLSRQRVLKGALSACNKNFNQNLTGWFVELFTRLEPTKAEIETLQHDIFGLLNSTHSKPVNTALKYFKDAAAEAWFDADGFMDQAPVLLASESKSTVTSTLMIMEKLAKKYPDKQVDVVTLAAQALIHADEGLQVRAAKLICKYGDATSVDLWEAVSAYQQNLLFEARNLLATYLIPTEEDTPEQEQSEEETALQEIDFPQSFDELVYLASQAFDQNQVYHLDLLPAALLKFQDELTADNIRKLLPAFQRAFKLITNEWTSTMGYLDNMLARFFADFGRLLIKADPVKAESIANLFKAHVDLLNQKGRSHDIETFSRGIKPWAVYSHSRAYKPHKHLLLNAFFLLEKGLRLPLLSTPTHQPCFVSIEQLIKRLNAYQNANVIPGAIDTELAAMRCFVADSNRALAMANSLLQGEARQLIGFILGESQQPSADYKMKTAWLSAALVHRREDVQNWLSFSQLAPKYLLGNFTWHSQIEHYQYDNYNYQLRRNEKVDATRGAVFIEMHKGYVPAPQSLIKGLWNKLTGNTATEQEEGYFDFIELKYNFIGAEANDISRLLCLSPFWTEHLLGYLNKLSFRYFDLTGEPEKRQVVNAMEMLMHLRQKYGSMGHLFIATCMLANDKTVRTYAAELWIKGVRESTIDSIQLGEVIGKHEHHGLAPLKRFTDLLLSNMLGISTAHNRALEELIRACVIQLKPQPITNAKKLLEVYTEVLTANKAKETNSQVITILNAWANASDGLKTVVKRIVE